MSITVYLLANIDVSYWNTGFTIYKKYLYRIPAVNGVYYNIKGYII